MPGGGMCEDRANSSLSTTAWKVRQLALVNRPYHFHDDLSAFGSSMVVLVLVVTVLVQLARPTVTDVTSQLPNFLCLITMLFYPI